MTEEHHHHHSGHAGNLSMRASQRSNGSHSHHHHRTVRGKIKSWLRHHKWFWPTVILILIAVLVVGFWLYRTVQRQKSRSVHAGVSYSEEENTGYRTVRVGDTSYKYKNNVRTVMLLALDSTDSSSDDKAIKEISKEDATDGYTLASVQLLVLDPEARKMSVLSIPPVMATGLSLTDQSGNGPDQQETLAGLFTAASSLEDGAAAVQEEVSRLLMGIPVSDYIVLDTDTLVQIVDSLGALDVTVPTDDLSKINPDYTKGHTVALTQENVSEYLMLTQGQDAIAYRLLRIESFSSAYILRMKEDLRADHQSLWKQLTAVEGTQFTSITASSYLGLASRLLSCDYEEGNYQIAAGTYEENGGAVFEADEQALLQQVLGLYYS